MQTQDISLAKKKPTMLDKEFKDGFTFADHRRKDKLE